MRTSSFIGAALTALVVGSTLLGCSKNIPLAKPAAPLTEPSRLCTKNEAPPRCRRASQVDALLASELTLLGMADTPSGSQGAKILTVRSASASGSVVFRVRWRAQSTSGLINEPRKELA